MSIKLFSKAALAGIAILAAQSVSAATFDFVDIADNIANPNYIGGTELNWSATAFAAGLTIDGVTLVASGSNADGDPADAFFDKGVAGLGVCSSVSCASGVFGANPGDDNVSGASGGETLTLAFDQTVSISDIFFRNAVHDGLTGTVNVNGNMLTLLHGIVTGGAAYLAGASTYDFEYIGSEFYISTLVADVPVPAAGLLLMGALGGLGFASRRRRKAA